MGDDTILSGTNVETENSVRSFPRSDASLPTDFMDAIRVVASPTRRHHEFGEEGTLT